MNAPVRACYPGAVWPPNPYQELAHAAYAICDVLSSNQTDVIHAHVASVVAFAHLLDVPIVYTIHHDREPSIADLYRLQQAPGLTMVAISARQADLLGDVCPTRVVHHGVDTSLYPLGEGAGGYAAFLGRLAHEKGAHTAIDVARLAGVTLRMAGRPHWKDEAYFRSELERRLRWPGVEWLGAVSHGPKVDLLGGACALLAPIDWEEPFGLVLIEAMLCGTPVIAFPRGSVPELIEPGVTGYIASDLEEMAAYLRSLRDGSLGFDRARCRARATRRFSRERMVDDYLAIYEESIGLRAASERAILQ